MRKMVVFILLFGVLSVVNAQSYEYKVVTSIESVVPSGLGRSRLISTEENRNYKDFSSTRSDEDDTRNQSDRSEVRVKNFEETKLLNFFNVGGIRFQNIAANDALISSKLSAMSDEGWELFQVTSAVESHSGNQDSTGIFITRFIFRKAKKI